MVLLSRQAFDAAVFELDGFLVNRAALHAAAWNTLLNEFLYERAAENPESVQPFDPVDDYRAYFKDRPVCEGVRLFLASRGIELPIGEAGDRPGDRTIIGMVRQEDELFLDQIDKHGVVIDHKRLDLLETMHSRRFRFAVVTTSNHSEKLIERTGLVDRIDAFVDGVDQMRYGLREFPAPDLLGETVRRLEVSPRRTVLIADSTAAVKAGKRAAYGKVIGLQQVGGNSFHEAGADEVVTGLSELTFGETEVSPIVAPVGDAPRSALSFLDEIIPGDKKIVLFLDFDGTLTRIVANPAEAELPESTRKVLARLSSLCGLGIISGRDLDNLRARVGLEGVAYGGSHGFDLVAPSGHSLQMGIAQLPSLDKAEQLLHERLGDIPGLFVERKKFSITVHYRESPEDASPAIRQTVQEIVQQTEQLRFSTGKKIFDLQPDIDWDKGRAILWLFETMGYDPRSAYPIYLGDDFTDEAAFRAVSDRGAGIVIQEKASSSKAAYYLRGPDEVEAFLVALAERLEVRRGEDIPARDSGFPDEWLP